MGTKYKVIGLVFESDGFDGSLADVWLSCHLELNLCIFGEELAAKTKLESLI